MNKIVYDLLLKLEQCDDRHNRCDYLMEHDEITYLLEYIEEKDKEIERLNKELLSKPDTKLTLETEDGQKLSIIQSERIDMQEELNKSIERLNNIINEVKDYVNFLILFNQTINGKFSETVWGREILDLLEENIELVELKEGK